MSSTSVEPEKEDSVIREASKNPRKRARKGTSCLQCRRRKLRCDGIRPVCARCNKSGHQEACQYDTDVLDEGVLDDADDVREVQYARVYQIPRQSLSASLEQHSENAQRPGIPRNQELQDALATLCLQQETISRLERQVSRLTDAVLELPLQGNVESRTFDIPPTNSTTNRITENPKLIERNATFKGKCFKSSFYGFTYPVSLTAEFDLLNTYSQGFLNRHVMLIRAVKDIQLLDKRRKSQSKEWRATFQGNSLPQLLPAKEVLDPLVNLYLDTLEHVYHVLHIPSFWKDYHSLWVTPCCETAQSFIATILLMAASTLCIREPKEVSFVGENSANRELAEKWIMACEQWQQTQSQKWLTMAYFQNRCLLIIAKFMTGCKVKRWYNETGTLVQFAVSAGLHIEPRKSETPQRLTIFDSEMRRRIWAAIVQLDIEACFHRGMPSTIDSFYHDCSVPINVEDGDLIESTQYMPHASGPEKFTSISCLVQCGISQDLRLRLLRLLNTPNANMPPSEFFMFEKRILQALGDIPPWNKQDNVRGSLSNEFVYAYITLHLRQILHLLYRKVLRKSHDSAISNYAQSACYTTAADIIKTHERLQADISFMIVCLRSDIVQAVLSICYDLSIVNIPTDPTFLMPLHPDPTRLFDLVDTALHLLEHRTARIGGIYRRYWVLSVAYTAVKTRFFPTRGEEYDHATADKISSIVYKMLSLQVDGLKERGVDTQMKDGDSKSHPTPHAGVELHQQQQQQGSSMQQHLPSVFVEYGLQTPMTDLTNVDFASVADWDWDDILRM